MRTHFDCIPCFIRQAINTVRLASDDPELHQKTLREILVILSQMDFQHAPVVMGRTIHRVIQIMTRVQDPYRSIKKQYNQMVNDLYPELQARIRASEDSFEAAARLALAGNIIDFGNSRKISPIEVKHGIEDSLSADISGDIDLFHQAVKEADSIVYLGDNCGEIVFDRLLIEQSIPEKVTYVVRSAPIINDVTMEDARYTGMTDLVRVIANGSDAPGTLLSECSPAFIELFEKADLVISKGQGNYETLHMEDKHIFFMLKVKCPVVAQQIEHELGDFVIQEHFNPD
jgi:uncharacterized protein with ATP-grasp and redox domains